MQSMIPFMRWQEMRLVTEKHSRAYWRDISANLTRCDSEEIETFATVHHLNCYK